MMTTEGSYVMNPDIRYVYTQHIIVVQIEFANERKVLIENQFDI